MVPWFDSMVQWMDPGDKSLVRWTAGSLVLYFGSLDRWFDGSLDQRIYICIDPSIQQCNLILNDVSCEVFTPR